MTTILATFLWAAVWVGAVASNETVVSELLIDPDDDLRTETTPVPAHDLDDWTDWETWQPPANIQQIAPFYKAGHDRDGLPVFVMEFGKWDYREIASLSENDVVVFKKYFEEIVRHVVKDGLANSNQGVVLICDWDGFSLKSFSSKESLKLAMRNFIAIVRLYHVLAYGFDINTNYAAETFIDVARPFLGNLLDKLEIQGTRSEKWKPALFRKISPDQLPPQYGGTNKEWKPVPL